MNPARTFGPDLVAWDFGSYWVYVAGPLIGAAIAVGCAVILRGRGGDPTSVTAASGSLRSWREHRETSTTASDSADGGAGRDPLR